MVYVIGYRIRVADYVTWKKNFDASDEHRKQAGEKSYQLFRAADDPNDLTLLCEWQSVEQARQFLESPELRQMQTESGVMEMPHTMTLTHIETG